jgi:hypothetical protein
MKCVCGHEKRDHIYEEGACRPGSNCGCSGFQNKLHDWEALVNALGDAAEIADRLAKNIPLMDMDYQLIAEDIREVRKEVISFM